MRHIIGLLVALAVGLTGCGTGFDIEDPTMWVEGDEYQGGGEDTITREDVPIEDVEPGEDTFLPGEDTVFDRVSDETGDADLQDAETGDDTEDLDVESSDTPVGEDTDFDIFDADTTEPEKPLIRVTFKTVGSFGGLTMALKYPGPISAFACNHETSIWFFNPLATGCFVASDAESLCYNLADELIPEITSMTDEDGAWIVTLDISKVVPPPPPPQGYGFAYVLMVFLTYEAGVSQTTEITVEVPDVPFGMDKQTTTLDQSYMSGVRYALQVIVDNDTGYPKIISNNNGGLGGTYCENVSEGE